MRVKDSAKIIRHYTGSFKVGSLIINLRENSHDFKLDLGNIQLVLGNTKDARNQYQEALSIYENTKYDYGIASAKFELGQFYSEIGEYPNASTYLYEALSIYDDQNNLSELTKKVHSSASARHLCLRDPRRHRSRTSSGPIIAVVLLEPAGSH